MNKRWLWIVLGVIAFCVILFGGVVTGAGLTYLFLHTKPVQAAREMIIESVTPAGDGYEVGVLVLHVEQDSPAAEAGIRLCQGRCGQTQDRKNYSNGKPHRSRFERLKNM